MNKNCIRLDCEEILIYLKAVLSFLIKILSKVHQNNPLFHDFNLYKETKMGQFLQRQMPEDGDCLYVPKVFFCALLRNKALCREMHFVICIKM